MKKRKSFCQILAHGVFGGVFKDIFFCSFCFVMAAGAGASIAAPIPAMPPGHHYSQHQLTSPLSLGDQILYEDAFTALDEKRYNEAQALIAKTDNALLRGSFWAEYWRRNSSGASLADFNRWLENYGDQPEVKRIYRLAEKKAGSSQKIYLPTPYQKEELSRGYRGNVRSDLARHVDARLAQVNKYLRRGGPTAALKVLHEKKLREYLSPAEWDQKQTEIAHRYFLLNEDEKAWSLASASAARSGDDDVEAFWIAGLAAWRLQKYDDALYHFTKVVDHPDAGSWLAAGGAYWAARCYWQKQDQEATRFWLNKAAHFPRTFYGKIATHALGDEVDYQWRAPELSADVLDRLNSYPGFHRARALLQINEVKSAILELRHLYERRPQDKELAVAVLAFARHAHLQDLGIRAATFLAETHQDYWDLMLYPVTEWAFAPGQKHDVDLALLHAIMHQESNFIPDAQSHAGARGLMQIMPQTANYVRPRRGLHKNNRNHLFDPELNLSIGDEYIRYLFAKDDVNNQLIPMIASYNGGFGNVRKWQKNNQYNEDPLLFVETITFTETRHYVKRVMTNLWAYRRLMGQETPSLDQAVAGKWPYYARLDQKTGVRLVRHDEDEW